MQLFVSMHKAGTQSTDAASQANDLDLLETTQFSSFTITITVQYCSVCIHGSH
jgi:hypothetical protein